MIALVQSTGAALTGGGAMSLGSALPLAAALLWLALLGVAWSSAPVQPNGEPDFLAQADVGSESQHLLVVDKSAGQLVVVDLTPGEVIDRIDVGFGPHEVVALAAEDSPTGSPLAIVSLYGTGQQPGSELAVVDLIERSVRLIDLGQYSRPHGLALLPGGSSVLVTVEQDDTVLLVDHANGEIEAAWPVAARLPHMVAVSPDGASAFAASITGAGVTRLPILGGEPLTVTVGAGAEGIAVTADGSEVWIGSNDESEVHVLGSDLAPLDVVPTCGVPIRVTRVGEDLMAITCFGANEVRFLEVDSHEVRASLVLPGANGRPVGTIATADGSRLYVATTADGRVHEVDIERAAVLRTFEVGVEPDGLALVTLTRP